MYICFAEYRILPEYREVYLEAISKLMIRTDEVSFYEGTDQPHLFVEVWQASTEAEAEAMKKERCDKRSSWGELTAWIDGGQAKLHVWTFKPVGVNH